MVQPLTHDPAHVDELLSACSIHVAPGEANIVWRRALEALAVVGCQAELGQLPAVGLRGALHKRKGGKAKVGEPCGMLSGRQCKESKALLLHSGSVLVH